MDYWYQKNKINFTKSHLLKFVYLITIYPEYRNLLHYRISRHGSIYRILADILMIFLPRMHSLKIYADNIGWNLYIEHGIATIISAKSIGDNCWINQQVTLGYNLNNEAPTIGNGVRICAGAKVLGGVHCGDNSIIGAGAVVVKDVSDNQIVVGIPATVIKLNTDHILWKKEVINQNENWNSNIS